MKPWYVVANDAERQRLQSLTSRLTDDDLKYQLDNGLTIATVFVHIAFWDEYCRALLLQCEQSGVVGPGDDYAVANEAILAVASAVPDRRAVEMAQDAANAVDAHVEALAPELAQTIEAEASPRMLERAAHRRVHLDQIERALDVS